MAGKLTLRVIALGYLMALLLLPLSVVMWRTLQHGLSPVWSALTMPDALHALYLTCLIALVAVPFNTVFGVLCALVMVRYSFPGKSVLNAILDLPLGVSPVVTGLALVAVYGRFGWFGPWLTSHNITIIFALPGMILATVFISLPFVAREVIPVLQEIGTEQEQAATTLGASSWQVFWRITVPAIRAGIGYGVVLTTARAIGEFGAVSVVAGNIVGQTQTMTLYVQDRFEVSDDTGAYTASVTLAMIAILTLLLMNVFRPSEGSR